MIQPLPSCNDKTSKNLANELKQNKVKSLISAIKDLCNDNKDKKKQTEETEHFLDGIALPSLTNDAPLTPTEYKKVLKHVK